MGASDLPLHVRQRIESKWSAQVKRMHQQRDGKLPQRTADGAEVRTHVDQDADEICMSNGVKGT